MPGVDHVFASRVQYTQLVIDQCSSAVPYRVFKKCLEAVHCRHKGRCEKFSCENCTLPIINNDPALSLILLSSVSHSQRFFGSYMYIQRFLASYIYIQNLQVCIQQWPRDHQMLSLSYTSSFSDILVTGFSMWMDSGRFWFSIRAGRLKKGARRPKASLGLQGFKILIKSGLKVWRGRDAMLRLDGGHTDPPDSHWSPIAHNTPLPMLRSNDERHDEQLREERDVDDDHIGPSRWPKLQWLFDEGISYFSAPTGTQHCHFTSSQQFCHNWYYYCYYLWLLTMLYCELF